MQKLFGLPLLIFAGQLCLGQTLVISHPAAPATGLGPSTPLRGGLGGTGLRLNLPPGLRPDGGNAEAEIAPGSQVNLGLFPQARLPQSDDCAARRGTLEIRPIGAATLMEVRVDVCLAPTVVLPDNLPLGPAQAHFRTESGEGKVGIDSVTTRSPLSNWNLRYTHSPPYEPRQPAASALARPGLPHRPHRRSTLATKDDGPARSNGSKRARHTPMTETPKLSAPVPRLPPAPVGPEAPSRPYGSAGFSPACRFPAPSP